MSESDDRLTLRETPTTDRIPMDSIGPPDDEPEPQTYTFEESEIERVNDADAQSASDEVQDVRP